MANALPDSRPAGDLFPRFHGDSEGNIVAHSNGDSVTIVRAGRRRDTYSITDSNGATTDSNGATTDIDNDAGAQPDDDSGDHDTDSDANAVDAAAGL